MARTIITVGPDPRGGWCTTPAGSGDEVSDESQSFRTKAEAVTAAVRRAESAERGQVVIKGRNGRIQSERTYGDDPGRFAG
jgi:hypothetical protein